MKYIFSDLSSSGFVHNLIFAIRHLLSWKMGIYVVFKNLVNGVEIHGDVLYDARNDFAFERPLIVTKRQCSALSRSFQRS